MNRVLPVFGLLVAAAAANAAPVVFCSNGGINLVTQGCISGTSNGYTPTTDGYYASPGDTEGKVEQAILLATGVAVDISLYGKSDVNPSLFTFNPADPTVTTSGSWLVKDGTLIRFISIKAANSFALYDVGNVSSGVYTTAGLLTGNGRNQPEVAHMSFWTVATPVVVPEPGTWALFGGGFALLAVARRRRKV